MMTHAVPVPPFEKPDFTAPVDVEAHITACPPSATSRGTFFQFLTAHVEKYRRPVPDSLFDGVGNRRWISWGSYPVRDFLRLAANAARIVAPEKPIAEALRQFGWIAYPSFADTMAGRVVLMALGDDADALMQVLPKAYAVSLTGAHVTSKRIARNHWEVELRDVYSFVSTYHVGVLEGGLRARGVEPLIRLRKLPRLCDADLEIRY